MPLRCLFSLATGARAACIFSYGFIASAIFRCSASRCSLLQGRTPYTKQICWGLFSVVPSLQCFEGKWNLQELFSFSTTASTVDNLLDSLKMSSLWCSQRLHQSRNGILLDNCTKLSKAIEFYRPLPALAWYLFLFRLFHFGIHSWFQMFELRCLFKNTHTHFGSKHWTYKKTKASETERSSKIGSVFNRIIKISARKQILFTLTLLVSMAECNRLGYGSERATDECIRPDCIRFFFERVFFRHSS